MDVEASHIVDMLQELGHEDPTCRRLALCATQGEPILKVCQAAIRALADDKQALRRLVVEITGKPR